MTKEQVYLLYQLSNMTIGEVAARVPVSRQTFHKWMSGEHKPGKRHTRALWELAGKLGAVEKLKKIGPKGSTDPLDQVSTMLADQVIEKIQKGLARKGVA